MLAFDVVNGHHIASETEISTKKEYSSVGPNNGKVERF